MKKLQNTIMNIGLAELYGALIGDGCISDYFSKQRNKYYSCWLITGHTHDEFYFRDVLQPILLKIFGIKGNINYRKNYNAVLLRVYNTKIIDYFKNQGFPVGKKGQITIPKIILNNQKFSIACVRGIFDTDGSVYPRYSKKYSSHKRKYDYINIEFKMNSNPIIWSVKSVLELNGIKCSKIRYNKKSSVVCVYDQKSVHRFFSIIKPSNQYHVERYLSLKKLQNISGGSMA